MLEEHGSYQRYMQLADLACAEGRNDEALDWLEKALRANPSAAAARNIRGEILWDAARVDDALREFDAAIASQPDLDAAHLNRLELMIEELADYDASLSYADELLNAGLDARTQGEVFYLKAKALFYLEDLEGALFLLRRAVQMHGEEGVYRGFQGQILFELGRLEEARAALQRSLQLEPGSGHTVYHLALVAEHMGDYATADRLFGDAEAAQPKHYVQPMRMPRDQFVKICREAVDSLPGDVRTLLGGCSVRVDDLPTRAMYSELMISPQQGGVLLLKASADSAVGGGEPTACAPLAIEELLLFQRNLEKEATCRDELVESVQCLVKQELCHHLGFDDDDDEGEAEDDAARS
jgi:tetratricopeptide (TPR) repeat protein